MSFLFNTAASMPLEQSLLESLENPVPSSVLSRSSDSTPSAAPTSTSNSNTRCYYGDSTAPSLQFFYGNDVPLSGHSCSNGLFSYGQQTQMHPISILFKYPYLHPIAIIYSLLFLWTIHWRIRIITIIIIIFIQFTIGESLKIHRHSSMEHIFDKIQIIGQLIGDILLIPYQWMIYPTECPLIQFQNTSINRYIFSNCKSILKFTPTFWCRNTLIQFIYAIFEEQYTSNKQCKIYREPIRTPDGGLIALDHWVDPLSMDQNEEEEKEEKYEEEYAEFEDIYKSKMYLKYNEQQYGQRYLFEDGDMTPILVIFTTYCGDSMSMPVRKMAEYFCCKGWRVISYTKRGCGSPYFEMLPLSNHKTFDLSGMDDANIAIQRIVNRYPLAPKICLGFSLGGSQLQDFLTKYNQNHNKKIFIGGIKIDGITIWTELIKFGFRQNLISKILGEVVHSSYIKSLFKNKDNDNINYDKVAMLQKQEQCKGFNFDKIIKIKSAECEILDVVKEIMCPAVGYHDAATYLHSVGPGDIDRIKVPLLVLNSWNDGFQDPEDMPIGIANTNPNIFHCITRLGAHCIRREGILNRICWQSKVSLEFATALLNANKYLK